MRLLSRHPGLVLLVPLIAIAGSKGDDPKPEPASIREAPTGSGLVKQKEHCSVDPRWLASRDVKKGRQVRIDRGESAFALFTVSEVKDEEFASVVRMGRLGRLRVGTTSTFEGTLAPFVARADLTDQEAKARGELVERLDDDGSNDGLLVMAPHGGQIETPTDLQAERVGSALKGKGVSTWRCKGFHPQGGRAAFERWHITSTDINVASYPLLGKVATRKFRYAVSFHGMTDDRVLVGGSGPTRLKVEIRDAIRTAVNDPKLAVDIALPDDANGGKDPANIVNRYVEAGGIQIEQSPLARREHWKAIADAVAKVYESRL